jgi:bifunctional DNA-binding transcriptional regulator/antitoxin component of YhaV-PrlF toxin-antitoxin module
LSVVEVDDRGRFTIPKEIGLRGTKVIVIPASTYFIVLPLHGDPYKYAKNWLKTTKSTETLKREADEAAQEDAAKVAKRREEG